MTSTFNAGNAVGMWVRWMEVGGWTEWREAEAVGTDGPWLVIDWTGGGPGNHRTLVPDHIVRGGVEIFRGQDFPQ